ncbi:trypsin-like serine peptidase [Streptomyces sp. NPDC058623]|uniref:trypsin-like serine peptidase n=1 Tax=Streptomyces sp. NPDC058623 TaxID=3346563 RepID=UPI00365A5228
MPGWTRGRTVRVLLPAVAGCALLAGGFAHRVELSALFGPVARGDAGRGSWVQERGPADRAGADVREALREEAPPDARPFAATGPDPAAARRPSDPLEARPVPAEPAIGALFSPGFDWDGDHHCSGSVLHSPGGDLVVTAAHCVHQGGFRTNLVFVPGYRDGVAPYGVWVPTRIEVDPRWVRSADPDHDVAFLRVRRAGPGAGGPGARLEALTGAMTPGFGPELPAMARLVGYPNDAEEPLGCANTAVAAGPAQLRLDCADVPNGTSGGPVLTGDRGRTLIGVIGGRDGGGDESTSYSSYLGADARALYERATTGPAG